METPCFVEFVHFLGKIANYGAPSNRMGTLQPFKNAIWTNCYKAASISRSLEVARWSQAVFPFEQFRVT